MIILITECSEIETIDQNKTNKIENKVNAFVDKLIKKLTKIFLNTILKHINKKKKNNRIMGNVDFQI